MCRSGSAVTDLAAATIGREPLWRGGSTCNPNAPAFMQEFGEGSQSTGGHTLTPFCWCSQRVLRGRADFHDGGCVRRSRRSVSRLTVSDLSTDDFCRGVEGVGDARGQTVVRAARVLPPRGCSAIARQKPIRRGARGTLLGAYSLLHFAFRLLRSGCLDQRMLIPFSTTPLVLPCRGSPLHMSGQHEVLASHRRVVIPCEKVSQAILATGSAAGPHIAPAVPALVNYRSYCRMRAEERRNEVSGAASNGNVLFCRSEFRNAHLEGRKWNFRGIIS